MYSTCAEETQITLKFSKAWCSRIMLYQCGWISCQSRRTSASTVLKADKKCFEIDLPSLLCDFANFHTFCLRYRGLGKGCKKVHKKMIMINVDEKIWGFRAKSGEKWTCYELRKLPQINTREKYSEWSDAEKCLSDGSEKWVLRNFHRNQFRTKRKWQWKSLSTFLIPEHLWTMADKYLGV